MRCQYYCILVLLFILFLSSCGSNSGNDRIIVNNEFSTAIDTMILKCQDLDGLGPFVLGKTTKKEITNEMAKFGFPSIGFTNLYSSVWGMEDKEIVRTLDTNNEISRMYYISKYEIGTLKFSRLNLAFLRDTLIAIDFLPDLNSRSAVINHYIEKYGNGDGHEIIDIPKTDKYDKQYYLRDIHHTWYNLNLVFTVSFFEESGPNVKPVFPESKFLMRTNDTRLEEFLSIQAKVIEDVKMKGKEDVRKSLEAL